LESIYLMKRCFFIIILQYYVTGMVYSQSFTVDDLLSLTTLPPKNIDQFMIKNGFLSGLSSRDDTLIVTRFFEKIKARRKDTLTKRSIDMYKKNDFNYYTFHTTSLNEYRDGINRLIKKGFFYDDKKDVYKETSTLFQKKNITIETNTGMKDDVPVYNFVLKKKELPDPSTIQFAEDLLIFNSHELLVGFFGEKNVKKDLYYFSEKELKKCSVLFGNSSRQVVFVWGDENNLCNLSYILVSNVIPTVSAEKFDGVIKMNEWEMENGIRLGMSIKELIVLNGKEFEFYGNLSKLAFTVKPEYSGKIDFKKTVIMLSCNNCNNDKLFNTDSVRAIDAAEENLPLYINSFLLYPVHL